MGNFELRKYECPRCRTIRTVVVHPPEQFNIVCLTCQACKLEWTVNI